MTIASSVGLVKIASTANAEASMCTWNFFDQSGNLKIGASTSFLLSSSKDC